MTTPLNGSLLKGFEILHLFSRERPEVGAATLQAELGMNAATAHRFLATLEEAGALFCVRRGLYRLGPATAEMGRLAEETNPYAHHVQPLVDRLRTELSESVMVCRLGRHGPTCVAVAAAERPITVSVRVGTDVGLATTAQGKVWLADLPADVRERTLDRMAAEEVRPDPTELALIRAQGFARNAGSAEPDIGAVAVPIRNTLGAIILTLSSFGPLGRITDDFLVRAVPVLKQAAAEIAARLDL